MLRRMSQLLKGCGMAADWGYLEQFAQESANDGDPNHIVLGRRAIRRVSELPMLGRNFNLRRLE